MTRWAIEMKLSGLIPFWLSHALEKIINQFICIVQCPLRWHQTNHKLWIHRISIRLRFLSHLILQKKKLWYKYTQNTHRHTKIKAKHTPKKYTPYTYINTRRILMWMIMNKKNRKSLLVLCQTYLLFVTNQEKKLFNFNNLCDETMMMLLLCFKCFFENSWRCLVFFCCC